MKKSRRQLTLAERAEQLVAKGSVPGAEVAWTQLWEIVHEAADLVQDEPATASAVMEPVYDFVRGSDPPAEHAVAMYERAADYLAAVYLSAPVADRAEALRAAVERVTFTGAGSVYGIQERAPLELIEEVLGEIPELDRFLPSWIGVLRAVVAGPMPPNPVNEHLGELWAEQHESSARKGWEGFLLEALGRHGGVDALREEVRRSPTPAAIGAWATAAWRSPEAAESVAVMEEAARLLPDQAAAFLDLAARAAQRLDPATELGKLDVAWRAEPTVARCLRWILAGDADATTIRERATIVRAEIEALSPAPEALVVLIRLLDGDLDAAIEGIRRAEALESVEHGVVVLAKGKLPKGDQLGWTQPYAQAEDHRADASFLIDLLEEPRLRAVGIGAALARAKVYQTADKAGRERIVEVMEEALSRSAAAMTRTQNDPRLIGEIVAQVVEARRASGASADRSGPAWVDAVHDALHADPQTRSAAVLLRKRVGRSGSAAGRKAKR